MAVKRANLAQLAKLREGLKSLTSAQSRTLVAQRLCATAVKLVSDEFRKSVEPYGKPWAPVYRNRKRDRRARAKRAAKGLPPRADKPLVDTGRLRASVAAYPTSTGLRVVLPPTYASFHQEGTRRIKQRRIVPDDGDLGPVWKRALEREGKRALADLAARKLR